MSSQDVQRKKHCDHCHLSFGLAEKRQQFGSLVVHEDPCLRQLRRAALQRMNRVIDASRFDRRA